MNGKPKYQGSVRGPVPADIVERVSSALAEALQSQRLSKGKAAAKRRKTKAA